jgi:branched-chain amino acid transport system substrate-binding protein
MVQGYFTRSMRALVLVSCLAAPAFAQTGAPDNVVKIGVLNDMSGPYSDLGGKGSVVAARMAIEDFGSKVLGVPVELISADHGNKPDVALGIAREWFDRQRVDTILDLFGSNVSLAVMDLAKAKNRVVFINGAGTTRITNDACTANSVHASWDGYSQSNGMITAIVKQGGDSWFFLTVDNVGGHGVEKDAVAAATAAGAKVLGTVRYPLGTSDFSSFMLQAQASKAKMIGLITSGADTVNAVKTANEFGLVKGGQTLVGLATFISEVHSLGLNVAQGMLLNESFYWDYDDQTRQFAQRFFKLTQKMPTGVQASIYSNVMHYLKSVAAAGTDDATVVMRKMKELPVVDFFARNGKIRENGRMIFDNYLAEIKKPQDSKYPWDYYTIKAVIPAEQAFQPLSESTCPLVKR